MALEDRKNWGEIHRDLPSKQANSTNGPARYTNRGEAGVALYSKSVYPLADEGTYFTATNATARTGLAGHAAPVIADGDTKAFLHMINNASSGTDTRIYLDFIRLTVTVAGAGATDQTYKTDIDTGSTRVTSGGTALTNRNCNMAVSSVASSALITAGAVVTAASSANERQLASGVVRTVVPVVGDCYVFDFGGRQFVSSNIVGGTAVANVVIPHVPVVLGPADQFLLHLWGVSQSGAHSYEVQVGWYER